jgi:hypothetical protein
MYALHYALGVATFYTASRIARRESKLLVLMSIITVTITITIIS